VADLAPTRPALRYHGGKWRLAPHIIQRFPSHRNYIEPYAGAASVLLRKPRSYFELYNDLDGEIVNLFSVLRDQSDAARLRSLLELTPYARTEFELSYSASHDRIEQARRTLIRSWMAHGSSGLRGHATGFRIGSLREFTTSAMDWAGFPDALPALVARLRGVTIESRPALDVIDRFDQGGDTLFYVDPPYMFETRSQKRIGGDLYHGYRYEMDDDAHRELLARLCVCGSMVVLSGYRSDLYDDELKTWRRIELDARADRGEARTEVMWLNGLCAAALDREAAGGPLFEGAA
jgi:DNA adenine methylase